MSKQNIREWLDKNGYIVQKDDDLIPDMIDQYTKDQSGWVSVDDRLPEDRQEVLVHMANGAAQSDLDTHTCKYFVKYGFERSRVTHWQPLPLPPMQEGLL